MIPKGHHQRGYLPHRDYGGALQTITFRLADSLPVHVVEKWKAELHSSDEENQKGLARRIARYEDAGHGNCYLRNPEVAEIVQGALIKGHDEHYQLIAWCIMPNHIHVLIRQAAQTSLGKIVRSWKGSTAREINLHLNREGPLWAKDYFDRAIRDQEHFWRAITYIHQNPVRANLVKEPADWPFSSKGQDWPLPAF
ncbi:transposase [Luteolibacter algae]|uniref:Transposase n=1 Tax=Luteolibacter algae TaxID=454151 RepID=A0ABW5D6E5_9BACT